MDKVQKLQRRLDSALARHEFYEAHQILRTICWRMLSTAQQKANSEKQPNTVTPEQQQQLLAMLYSGCLAMCKADEFASALDLAELYIDALKKMGQRLDSEEQFKKLTTLFAKLPAEMDDGQQQVLLDKIDRQLPAASFSHFMPNEEIRRIQAMGQEEDRRTPFRNKTLDWALKSANGQPHLLDACVQLQLKFAKILEGEGREIQAERLLKAADWLRSEIDRKTQGPSSSAASTRTGGTSEEEMITVGSSGKSPDKANAAQMQTEELREFELD